MTRNIWTRALWGGVIGVIAEDLVFAIGRAGGWMRINLLSALAGVITSRPVASSPSGMILGFVVHVLASILWALIFTAVIRAFHSRHNLVAGLISGLLMWLLWGLTLTPAGITPAPWTMGTPTTIFTLVGTLAHGVAIGWAVSEEAVGVRT